MLSTQENQLRVIESGTALSGRLTRREMVQRLLAGMSAGAIWPLAGPSHPIFEHFKNAAILNEAEKLGAADWKPVFLSSQQNESLIALAESIVPGSTKAQVNRFVDLLLSVDTPERQNEVVESLTAFEAEAEKQFAKSFPSLDENQKNGLLTDTSTAGANSHVPGSQAVEEHGTMRSHFENLKGWVSGAYYSSELGMRELGWTGDYVFEKFPGCEHPDGHP